jgi:hypothetical protein
MQVKPRCHPLIRARVGGLTQHVRIKQIAQD